MEALLEFIIYEYFGNSFWSKKLLDANLGSFGGTVIKNPARNIIYINLPRIRECFMILELLWAGIFSAIGQLNMVTTTSHNHSMKILMGLEKRTCI